MAENDTTESKLALPLWFDPIAKSGALLLVAIYAAGYLITSIHFASFGMDVGNPLKPRVGATGVLFAFLVGLPLWARAQIVRRSPRPAINMPTPLPSMWTVLEFAGYSPFLGILITGLFDMTGYQPLWRAISFWALSVLLFFTISFIPHMPRWWEKCQAEPHLVMLVAMGFIAAFVWLAWPVGSVFGTIQVVLLVFLIGTYPAALDLLVRSDVPFRSAQKVAYLLVPTIAFANLAFPHIKPQYGGGATRDVVVTFTKDSAAFPSQHKKVKLIDEEDQGYYFHIPENEHSAFYVPRASVAVVEFSSPEVVSKR